jgi:exosome complex component RRP4
MDKLSEAIDIIIRESHISGLTDRISHFLQVNEEDNKKCRNEEDEVDTEQKESWEKMTSVNEKDSERVEKINDTGRMVDQLLDTDEN